MIEMPFDAVSKVFKNVRTVLVGILGNPSTFPVLVGHGGGRA
jgi:hypothetical protein